MGTRRHGRRARERNSRGWDAVFRRFSFAEPSGSVAKFLAPLELARFRNFFAPISRSIPHRAAPLNYRAALTQSTFVPAWSHPEEPFSMTRLSQRVALVCA